MRQLRLPALFVTLAIAAVVLLAAGCGDGPTAKPSPAAAVGSPTPTPIPPGGFGPPPTLGGNVKTVTPAHGTKISQAQTRTTNAKLPHGMCADVSFDGLPETGQWFRIAIDGKEVTASKDVYWILASSPNDPSKPSENPQSARVCYAPPNGFTIGIHQAAITVQNPRSPSEPTREAVAWAFEVTP